MFASKRLKLKEILKSLKSLMAAILQIRKGTKSNLFKLTLTTGSYIKYVGFEDISAEANRVNWDDYVNT